MPGWRQEYVQLTTDAFAGSITRVDFGNLSIFRETLNQATINRYVFPEDQAFVSINLRNSARALASGGAMLGLQGAFLSKFRGDAECLNMGPVDFVGICFAPEGALMDEEHRWTTLGGAVGPLGEWIAALIGAFARGHASADLQKLAPMLIEDRLSLHLETRACAPRPDRSQAARIALEALAVLRELRPDELSVKSLSQRLGHSAATLRACYRAHIDADLDTALYALRMSAVRRRLAQACAGTDTVSGIAADHGFLHWGRFAAGYRAMFGELPVETLRRTPRPH